MYTIPDFTIHQGDTLPPLVATMKDGNGNPVDLTDVSTVTLTLKDRWTGVQVLSVPCTVSGSPAAGLVEYVWQPGDTATPSLYEARWTATWPSSRIESFPSSDDPYSLFLVRIAP